MKQKKISQGLSDFLEKEMMKFSCWKRIMFGCPVYFINNNMFAGVHRDGLFIRLSDDDRNKILGETDAKLFDPMKGRPMKEYIILPDSILDNDKLFDYWLNLSYEYASKIKPKNIKIKRKVKKMDRLKVSAIFNASAEELYSAWMSSKKHSGMTGSNAKIINKKGGKFEVWDKYITGKSLELEPYQKIVQSWRTTDFSADDADSFLEILFEEKKGKTKITLIHTNIPKGQGANYKKGWIDYYFTPMKEYFKK